MKPKTILDTLKEYKSKTNETYEKLAQDIGVSYSTIFRWLNKEPKLSGIHIKAVHEYLVKKNFIKLIILLSVTWSLDFRPDYSTGEITTYSNSQEFESFKQITEFIRNAPPDDKVWECEKWGRNGYCRVYDFDIVNTDGQPQQSEEEESHENH